MPMIGTLPRLPQEQTNIGALQSFAGGMRGLAGDVINYRAMRADRQVQSQLLSIAERGAEPDEVRSALLDIVGRNPRSQLGQKLGMSVIQQMIKEGEEDQFGTPPWYMAPTYKETRPGKIAAGIEPRASARGGITPAQKLAKTSTAKRSILERRLEQYETAADAAEKRAEDERQTPEYRRAYRQQYHNLWRKAEDTREELDALDREQIEFYEGERPGPEAAPTAKPATPPAKPERYTGAIEALPPDRKDLVVGTVYQLVDGRTGRWNGSLFDILVR